MSIEPESPIDARFDRARGRRIPALVYGIVAAATIATAASNANADHTGGVDPERPAIVQTEQSSTADNDGDHITQTALHSRVIPVGEKNYITNYLLYGNVCDMDSSEGFIKKTSSIPDMNTTIPSKEDEDRVRESLTEQFREQGFPEAPALQCAICLSREFVMAAAHRHWATIPKYRPIRDKVKAQGGKYNAGDHFAAFWQASLDRGILYRQFVTQHDEDYSADLATFISRSKKKNPDSAIPLPTSKDYSRWQAENADTLFGEEAFTAIMADRNRSNRMT